LGAEGVVAILRLGWRRVGEEGGYVFEHDVLSARLCFAKIVGLVLYVSLLLQNSKKFWKGF